MARIAHGAAQKLTAPLRHLCLMQAERAQQEARNGALVVPLFAELVRTGAVAEAQRRLERIPVELAEQLWRPNGALAPHYPWCRRDRNRSSF